MSGKTKILPGKDTGNDTKKGVDKTFKFLPENTARIPDILDRYPAGRHESAVMPLLTLAQRQIGGWLTRAAMDRVAEILGMAPIRVYEVATFYAHFDVVKEGETPPPALTIRVCDSLSCELAGAQALKTALEEGLDPTEVRVLRAPCMGRCDTAPVLELGHNHIDHATPEKVLAAIGAGDTHATCLAMKLTKPTRHQGVTPRC